MWAEFQVLHDMINRRGNFMQKCLDTVQIKKNNGIKIQPQYLPASPPACICRYAETKFPSRFLQLTQVSRVLAWLSRIFALAMPLFLCISRQPTEFPLPFFPLCTQLLSALPQQGQEVNKWKNPELLHLSVYLSNTVQPQWVKDCCWRQQSQLLLLLDFFGFMVSRCHLLAQSSLVRGTLQLLSSADAAAFSRWCNPNPPFLGDFLELQSRFSLQPSTCRTALLLESVQLGAPWAFHSSLCPAVILSWMKLFL